MMHDKALPMETGPANLRDDRSHDIVNHVKMQRSSRIAKSVQPGHMPPFMSKEDDRMETSMNSATSERQKTLTFSCSSCGGRPVWDPSLRKLKCPFCGSVDEIEIDQTPPEVYDLHTAPSEQAMEWGEQTQVVRCEGCGALTVLGQGESASVCPFCGSPRILEDQSSAGIAPESILPFEVTKEAAVSSFRGWLKKKLFAPGKAKRMAALGQITGVYLPHWAYDSDTISHYIGEAGYHYQVEVQVEVERDGKKVKETRMETRTRWEPTSGVVSHSFREILIPGSTRLPESLLEQVQPYQLKELCRYHPGFVAGFMAEKPEVDVQEGWKTFVY